MEGEAAGREVAGQEVINKVPLTDEEAGVMLGFSVAEQAILRERVGYESNIIAKRLGIHPSRMVQFNAKEKWISVRDEAPVAS